MSQNQVIRKPDNCFSKPITTPINFKHDSIIIHKHLVRDGDAVKVVIDGEEDLDATIQSQKCNAGLENILRLQEMRFGTVENAIERAKDNGVYADVSNLPKDVAGAQELAKRTAKASEELKAKYGLSDDDLKSMDLNALAEKIAKSNMPQETPTESENK